MNNARLGHSPPKHVYGWFKLALLVNYIRVSAFYESAGLNEVNASNVLNGTNVAMVQMLSAVSIVQMGSAGYQSPHCHWHTPLSILSTFPNSVT